MKKALMTTVAATALLVGTSLAFAQSGRQAPASGMNAAPAERSAPTERMDNKAGSAGTAATEEKGDAKRAQAPMKEKSRSTTGQGSSDIKGTAKEQNTHEKSNMSLDTKANDKTHAKESAQKSSKDSKNNDVKSSESEKSKSSTTGQGAAGSHASVKLSSEQRTRISTLIKEKHVAPVTHVNFSISVGTRVPRTVKFYPVPVEVVDIYPEFRGYEFILVGNDIVIIDPHNLEIVAVISA